MKALTKVILGLTIWTVLFFTIGGIAAEKALNTDPQLIANLEKKYNVQIHFGGMSSKNVSIQPPNFSATKDNWNIAPPAKLLNIQTISGNVSIKQTSNPEIKISAEGDLDKNNSPRLLEVKEEGGELIVKQPDGDVSMDLQIQIEIPSSFQKDLEIKTTSGNIALENLNLGKLTIKTVSGDIVMNHLNGRETDIKSVSGDITSSSSLFNEVEGKSVSGSFEFTIPKEMNIEIATTSGGVNLFYDSMMSTKFNTKSVSGNISNPFTNPEKSNFDVNVKTVSGDITIK